MRFARRVVDHPGCGRGDVDRSDQRWRERRHRCAGHDVLGVVAGLHRRVRRGAAVIVGAVALALIGTAAPALDVHELELRDRHRESEHERHEQPGHSLFVGSGRGG